jgi:hypothetical protein
MEARNCQRKLAESSTLRRRFRSTVRQRMTAHDIAINRPYSGNFNPKQAKKCLSIDKLFTETGTAKKKNAPAERPGRFKFQR